METLQIKKAAAIAAHKNAKNSGKKLLEDLLGKKTFQKEVTDRIKTFDDVLAELGTDSLAFHHSCTDLTSDEKAYKKIKLICEALNEGWTPDWGDSGEYKYYPWFDMGDSSGSGFSYDDFDYWLSYSGCGSRLCFKSSKLAKYAGQQFTDIYKDYFLINK